MNPARPTRRVALTGGIGTGKSYVRQRLDDMGVATIDADRVARDAVAVGTPALAAITARFGPTILRTDGTLDRQGLARLVFADPAARLDLEAIVHPVVRAAIDRWFDLQTVRGVPFAVADIPLLYETGRDADFAAVIVAACGPEQQLARVMARDGVSAADAAARIAAQWPIADKVARATHVIRTDGTFEDTTRQTEAVVRRLIADAGGSAPAEPPSTDRR